MRKLATITTAVVATAIGLAALAGAANAAEPAIVKQQTNSFSAPSSHSPPVQFLRPLDRVHALCYIEDGEAYQGSSWWIKIENQGKTGWVPTGSIHTPAGTPPC